MTDIYLVFAGEYSDRRVVGVFSSEHAARTVINAMRDGGVRYPQVHADPVLMTLDSVGLNEIAQGLRPWRVTMLMTGAPIRPNYDVAERSDNVETDWHGATFFDTHREPWMYWIGWARDREHAIKIANEKRIAHLAGLAGSDTAALSEAK